jgi:hypothetical protein
MTSTTSKKQLTPAEITAKQAAKQAADAAAKQAADQLAALFGVAPVKNNAVVIPSDLADAFKRAMVAFDNLPNTEVLPQVKGSDDDAALYEKQIRQYAKEHGRSCSVKRDGTLVTWRFSKVSNGARGKRHPVTVTQVTPAA